MNNSNEWHKRKYYINRKIIDTLKAVPCHDCKNSYPTYVMDFDHREPKEKRFDIARCMAHPIEKILKEIEKCDVVCSNCHRIRTHLREARKCN